ncbi:MAG: hypothetical protein AAF487_10485 [Bacteroidota bacterium]
MSNNVFHIIEPNESAPENSKEELMTSVKSIVLVLRFVQLFLGDYSNVLLDKFKSDKHLEDTNNQENG